MNLFRSWFSSLKRTTPVEPSTLRLETSNPQLKRPIVFDPSLKHIPKALRAGEPHFLSPVQAAEWQAQRMKVLWHVLDRVTTTNFADHLVLRGSTVMASWFGEKARIPGDLDWVVVPKAWRIDAAESVSLIDSLLTAIRGTDDGQSIRISPDRFAIENIWAYEKAPGKRIVFAWESELIPLGGTIQMDIVFGEQIPDATVFTDIQLGSQPVVSCRTASRAQSLAWKLLWLETDMHPMGKDLYDAVLLAESTPVTMDLIRATFEVAGERWSNPADLHKHGVEWEPFLLEYPHVVGTVDDWITRLVIALEPLG